MAIDRKIYFEKITQAREEIINLNGRQNLNDHLWWSLLSEKMLAIPRYINRNDADLSKALIELSAWIELWVCSKDTF
ncbi:MAG: hypothetical protein OXD54_16315 [Candidatus Poribacteria bacterium]|nr:hypothetical protein [Candidatus Poribacteria bacterium]